jgi:hypothetical protein
MPRGRRPNERGKMKKPQTIAKIHGHFLGFSEKSVIFAPAKSQNMIGRTAVRL